MDHLEELLKKIIYNNNSVYHCQFMNKIYLKILINLENNKKINRIF